MGRVIVVANNSVAAIVNSHPDILSFNGGAPLVRPMGSMQGQNWVQTHLAGGFDEIEFATILDKAEEAGYNIDKIASNSDAKKNDNLVVFSVDNPDHLPRILISMDLMFDPEED